MSIDASAVNAIAALASAALQKSARPIEVPGMPGHFNNILLSDGWIKTTVAPPQKRNHLLRDREALRAFLQNLAEGKHDCAIVGDKIDDVRNAVDKPYDPVVWVGDRTVTVVCDDGTRHDRAFIDLHWSEPFAAIADGHIADMRTQRAFVELLRTTLAPTLSGTSLLSIVRALRFTNNSGATVAIQHGRESLGKEVLNEVTGETALPDEVRLSVRLFDVAGFERHREIRCALLVDAERGTLALRPLPHEIANALAAELGELVEEINAAGHALAYRGEFTALTTQDTGDE